MNFKILLLRIRLNVDKKVIRMVSYSVFYNLQKTTKHNNKIRNASFSNRRWKTVNKIYTVETDNREISSDGSDFLLMFREQKQPILPSQTPNNIIVTLICRL